MSAETSILYLRVALVVEEPVVVDAMIHVQIDSEEKQ